MIHLAASGFAKSESYDTKINKLFFLEVSITLGYYWGLWWKSLKSAGAAKRKFINCLTLSYRIRMRCKSSSRITLLLVPFSKADWHSHRLNNTSSSALRLFFSTNTTSWNRGTKKILAINQSPYPDSFLFDKVLTNTPSAAPCRNSAARATATAMVPLSSSWWTMCWYENRIKRDLGTLLLGRKRSLFRCRGFAGNQRNGGWLPH